MVSANELRIGNWLYGKNPLDMSHDEVGYFKVANLEEDKINVWRVFEFDDEFATADPIPLTEDILIKLRFQKIENRYYLLSGFYIQLVYDESQNKVGYFIPITKGRHGTPFFYVHQLQNVHYSLYQEELEINL